MTIQDILLLIIKNVMAVGCAIFFGNGAVYFFNKIPAKWLTEYGEEPSKELQENNRQRIKSTPWKHIFTALFAVLGFYFFYRDWLFALPALITIWLLLLISIGDIKYMIIPDQLVMALAVTTIGFLPYYQKITTQLWGALMGLGIMVILAVLGLLIYKRETIGGGDIKLISALGLLLGARGIIVVLIITSLVSATYYSIMLISKRISIKDALPMAPHIAIATTIYLVFLWDIVALSNI